MFMYILGEKLKCDVMSIISVITELQDLGIQTFFIVFLGFFCKFLIIKNKI